jgi:hypothetical protein
VLSVASSVDVIYMKKPSVESVVASSPLSLLPKKVPSAFLSSSVPVASSVPSVFFSVPSVVSVPVV